MKFYFVNKGIFDVNAMTTFGVSAKEFDGAFGKFGTGFKYAVAVILRLGGEISVESGGKEYVFSTRKETIRGKDFNIILMNGESISVTTHFGINWEPWMAFRELFCNAKDEQGEVQTELSGDWDTVVTVDCTEFGEVYSNWNSYFLSGEPLFSAGEVDVYEGKSSSVFYQGVKVYQMDSPICFKYNIRRGVSLTEERVAKFHFEIQDKIGRTIINSQNRDFIKTLLDDEESEILLVNPYDRLGDEFQKQAREKMKTKKGIPENIRVALKYLDIEESNFSDIPLKPLQEKSYAKAVSFLKTIDITVEDFPVRFVESLGQGVMGRALDGEILIAETTLHMGTKQLASTLIEEWVHLKEGVRDFDRNMQSWLFDKILSLGEEINQEVL